jgi:hypothetical protein
MLKIEGRSHCEENVEKDFQDDHLLTIYSVGYNIVRVEMNT